MKQKKIYKNKFLWSSLELTFCPVKWQTMKESIGHTAHIISLLEQCKNVTFYQNDAIYSEMSEAALDVICLLSDMTTY